MSADSRGTARLIIPEASEHEEWLAATAAATRVGAWLASQHGVEAQHFYSPACRRVFEAAVIHAAEVNAAEDAAPLDADWFGVRPRTIATLADVDLAWLERIIDDRPTQNDRAGTAATAVIAAARRRAIMRAAADLYELASVGDLAEVPALLEEVALAG